MDDAVISLLSAIAEQPPDDPKATFEAVGTVLAELSESGADTDVEQFTRRFTELAGSGVGELVGRHLQDNDGGEILRKLAEERPDDLQAEYQRLLAEAAAAEAGDGYDEAAWNAFLAEYGTGWNGDPDAWDSFRTWFQYYADKGRLTKPATDFLDQAASQSDRIAFFAQHGVTIGSAEAPEAPEAPAATEGAEAAEAAGVAEASGVPEDEGVWRAFLAEYGTAWNGEDGSWADFVPYFLYYAGERNVAVSAQSFLDNAPDDVAGRIAYFAANGVTIEAAGAEPVPETADVSTAQAQFDAVAQVAQNIPPELEGAVSQAFADLVQEMPEAAALSPEQMRELLTSDELATVLADVPPA